jgi:hypothetical protein
MRSRPKRSLRIVRQVIAVLFLQAIALDLADASCDPILAPGTEVTLSSAQEESGEPCSGFCVSDCFCCSPSLTDDCAWNLGELDPIDPARIPAESRLAPGVPRHPDRPPRLLAS